MGGAIRLDTDAEFKATDLSKQATIAQNFQNTHQAANDAEAISILRGVQSGEIKMVDGKANYEESTAEDNVLTDLEARGLPVEIEDFRLRRLDIDIQSQHKYRTFSEETIKTDLSVSI